MLVYTFTQLWGYLYCVYLFNKSV